MAALNAKRGRCPFGNAPDYMLASRALRRHAANARSKSPLFGKMPLEGQRKNGRPGMGRPQTTRKEDADHARKFLSQKSGANPAPSPRRAYSMWARSSSPLTGER